MTVQRILTLCALFILVDAKLHNINETHNICELYLNTTNKIQCYCVKDAKGTVVSADCCITNENVKPYDPSWNSFTQLKKTHRLTLTNTRGFSLNYIPTIALQHTKDLIKLNINHGNIKKIEAFAFANLSYVEEIFLRDSQIKALGVNAFTHHNNLITINLERNQIVEINRNVFKHLPALEKIFLTSNKINTIHDRAFIELMNLRELEINSNSLFTLNSETFAGLKKLLKLDLSSNSLEVIGDNTFLPLVNLRSLNLDGNKIQMLDDKAFNGLYKMHFLSLAHNNLRELDNVMCFDGLESLNSLSLRANSLGVLKSEVMAPILNNFYSPSSSLDVEDNNFPCNCNLDWFISLMNRTQSTNLKLSLENIKCYPDPIVKELWNKAEEMDNNAGQVFDDESEQRNTEYEYYDESQLDGRLFYIDIRYLLNCSNPVHRTPRIQPTVSTTKPTTQQHNTTEATTENTTTPSTSTTKYVAPMSTQLKNKSTIANHGLLDLYVFEQPTKYEETKKDEAKTNVTNGKQDDVHTTSSLVTVSANPIDNKHLYEEGMASDEAKPDKLKTHRSVQEDYHDDIKMNEYVGSHSSARQNLGCVTLILTILSFRLQ